MFLNNIRWFFTTLMWVLLMYYFIAKGKLTEILEMPAQ